MKPRNSETIGETCMGSISLDKKPEDPSMLYFKIIDGGTPNQRSIPVEYNIETHLSTILPIANLPTNNP